LKRNHIYWGSEPCYKCKSIIFRGIKEIKDLKGITKRKKYI